MTFDFDRIIPRTATNAVAEDGFENYLFGDDADLNLPVPQSELISMGVADMQYAAPQALPSGGDLYDAFHGWCVEVYGWRFDRDAMQVSLGVIPALYALAEY